VDTLQSTFDKIGVSKSQIQKEIKSEGAKLIYENNEYLLYEIYNHEASCYYGSGTKWCITGKNPNNPYGGSRAWDGYTKNGAKFMFLIKKNGDINDNYYKVAIAYKDKDNVRYILAAFDALDKQINKSTLKSITKSVGNSWDYTYFENKKWVGYVPFGTMSTEEMLNKVVEGTYTIQSNGTVDVNGNVYMYFNKLTKIPIKFGKVTGYFYCHNNQLTSLEGAPQSVGGSFDCSENQLTSLKGSPKSVGGNFNCMGNKLKSLLDGPELVENNFICNENQLTSLDGAPQSVGGSFSCWDNQLTSLKGAPQSVGGDFNCFDNQLTSLDGSPQSVGGSFSCWDNQLTSLIGAPKSVGGDFDCKSNRIKFTEDDVRAVSDVKGNIIV
jgi:hypothetical protein